jgi:uncharacterized protein YegL
MENPVPIYGLRPVDIIQFEPTHVPLTFIKVNATINTFLSAITITQFYINLEDTPIECEYVFPLDDNGVVTHLAVQFDDGKELTACVDDKKEAENTYNQAIASGHSAVLARTNEPDKMILNIGNLPPNGRAKVTVTYTSPLSVVNEQWKFLIPVAITPLYNLDYHFGDQDREATDFPVISAESCPYSIGFTIQIEAASVIQDLKSLNHQVDIQYIENNKKATVTLAVGSTYKTDRNFILTFYTNEAYMPHGIRELNDGGFTSMLSFIPKFLERGETEDDLEGSGEYIFILDRSGSMEGERIAMATKAVVLFLKSLPADSRFNIISFGSTFGGMFQNSVTYNRESLNRAINELSLFGADFGGTEILEPIKHVLQQESDPQYPKTIFLLTDGDVSSPDQVVKVVAESSARARVHTIGIGEGVSTYLIKEVAKAGKGSYSFVSKNEDLNSTVTAALRRTILPAMTKWTLNLNAEIVPNPITLSTIYFNEPFVVFARTQHEVNQQASIKAYNTKTRDYEIFEILPEHYHNIVGNNLEKLWHKHKIQELEYEISRGKSELKQTVIDISIKYQIPSKYTAYVAVERRSEPLSGERQYVKIPISLTSDSNQEHHFFGLGGFGVPVMMISSMPLAKSMAGTRTRAFDNKMAHVNALDDLETPEMEEEPANFNSAACMDMDEEKYESFSNSLNYQHDFDTPGLLDHQTTEQTVQEPMVGYMSIVSLQEPQGFWELTSLSGVIRVPYKPHELDTLSDSDQVWATLVALAYLEKDFGDKIDDWALVQRKAKRWLKNKGVGDDLFELANKLVWDY